MKDCDTESGRCGVAVGETGEEKAIRGGRNAELLYFGDPMCSWCWGISPQLPALRDWGKQNELAFRLVMGGLRAGGGETWDTAFREFLRHHWRDVSARTGQPFSEDLLARPQFDYDTEPACRAVVTARDLGVVDELEFMYRIQRRFYVMNQDPKAPAFYTGICEELGVDAEEFFRHFESDAMKTRTLDDFAYSRRFGISSFPTVLLLLPSGPVKLASGYARFDEMRDKVERYLDRPR